MLIQRQQLFSILGVLLPCRTFPKQSITWTRVSRLQSKYMLGYGLGFRVLGCVGNLPVARLGLLCLRHFDVHSRQQRFLGGAGLFGSFAKWLSCFYLILSCLIGASIIPSTNAHPHRSPATRIPKPFPLRQESYTINSRNLYSSVLHV